MGIGIVLFLVVICGFFVIGMAATCAGGGCVNTRKMTPRPPKPKAMKKDK